MNDSSYGARESGHASQRRAGDSPQLVRLRDIAELAGVHVTTVSAVLSPSANSRTRVGEKTASRIRELARRLNYRPHLHAQMMRKRKTGLIGLIEFGRSEIHSQRTMDLVRAVRSVGYRALTTNVLWYDDHADGSGVQAALDHVLGAQVEGVILITPTAHLSPSDLYQIQDVGIPCVAFNGVHFPEIPQVRSDVTGGAEMLTEHLLGLGHKRLALLTTWGTTSKDESTCWPTLERMAGFKAAIQKHGGSVVEGMPAWKNVSHTDGVTGGIFTPEAPKRLFGDCRIGYEGAMGILGSGNIPDALFCTNDRHALGALHACFEMRVDVPGQIAVVGFAGESDTKYFSPALTTIDTLDASNAQAALDVLLEIMRGERPLKESSVLKMPCRLIVRESCGASSVCKSSPG